MRFLSICLLAALLLFTPFASLAESSIVVGVDGADGLDGAAGENGDDGLAGDPASALANAAGESNTAEAYGGRGGDGGDGGDALVGSGDDGGDGGAAGDGGSATAEAVTVGADSVRAAAYGGDSGFGGSGGLGSPPGMDGTSGARGLGGDATATASIDQSFPASTSTSGLDGEAIAIGGDGGGGATATIVGEASGAGSTTAVHSLSATAHGGDLGMPMAGSAIADATGTTSHGALTVEAEAVAGRGFPGGDATATAMGTHTGSGQLTVEATANVFDGGMSLDSGVGQASASGVATNGADVSVTANLFGGRDTELRDAVSGSTSGTLSLQQRQGSYFLPSGQSPPSSGVTRTGLVATNPGGGDLAIRIDANTAVGELNAPEPDDGDLVIGDVVGTVATSNVDVLVSGTGRHVRLENLDDAGTPSQIQGFSNGGDVSVRADLTSSDGFLVEVTPTAWIGADGAAMTMDDTVSGDTSGQLTLSQNARAGAGTDFPGGLQDPPTPLPLVPGRGGDAYSRITRSGSFESLSVQSTATSGRGGGVGRMDDGGDAGNATSIVDLANDAGAIGIIGMARAQAGGSSYGTPGRGGDATGDFRATTTGDGQSITIGTASMFVRDPVTRQNLFLGARGGAGGTHGTYNGDPPTPAAGGQATSRSEGVAAGNSEVMVFDLAEGGDAGQGGGFGLSSVLGTGERGGDATSEAIAMGGGTSAVLAHSRAIGGSGSRRVTTGGMGGDASAIANGTGAGDTQAQAIATGGDVSVSGELAGSAHALASVSGPIGAALADAQTGTGSGATFRAAVTRTTATSTAAEATATFGTALPTAPSASPGAAFITGSPLAQDVTLARSRNVALDALLAGNPGARVEGLAQWSASPDGMAPSSQTVELDIVLVPQESDATVALAVFELDSAGGGFESLAFRVEVAGTQLGDEMVFDTLAEANAYFASLVPVGSAFDAAYNPTFDAPAVRAIFDVVTGAGQSVELGVAAVVVPEPSTALFVGLGLAVLVQRGRRHQRSVAS